MNGTWTVNSLSTETGLDRATVKRILAETAPTDVESKGSRNVEYYTLRDFVQALIAYYEPSPEDAGSLEKAKTRDTNLSADIKEIELAKARMRVIDTTVVDQVWQNVATAIRRTILTSALNEQEKDVILRELQTVSVNSYVEQREFDQGAFADAE